MSNLKNQRGMMLVELVFAILVMSIISVVIAGVIQTSSKAYLVSQDNNELTSQTRYAFQRFSQDLIPRSSVAIISANTTQISFSDKNNSVVTYSIASKEIDRNGIVFISNTNSANTLFQFYDANLNQLSSPVSASNLLLIKYVLLRVRMSFENSDITVQTMIDLRNA